MSFSEHPTKYRVAACPNSVAAPPSVEDGWKGEEGEGEDSPGETRQSHEEHMKQLAGMANSPPSNGPGKTTTSINIEFFTSFVHLLNLSVIT